jgi:hypothetical protein
MNAFIKLNKGLMQMPVPWRTWVMLLVLANLVVPLFYLSRLEAQVVLGVAFISLILMTVITAYVGYTRLLGLGHVLWIPLVYFLWTRLGSIPADYFFGIWIRVLMTLNAISLVIDAIE